MLAPFSVVIEALRSLEIVSSENPFHLNSGKRWSMCDTGGAI